MTKSQVTASRGKPASVKKLSANEEMWTYGSTRVVFLNGSVSSVR